MYARAKLHDGLQITLARQSVFDTLGLKREYSSFVFNDAGRRAQCYYSHVEIQKSERRETIKVYALPCHPDCLGCPNCVMRRCVIMRQFKGGGLVVQHQPSP